MRTPCPNISAPSLCIAFALAGASLANALSYSEAFDSQETAKVGNNNGTGMIVEFVDYSNLTLGAVTHQLPEAPRQVAGSAATRGVLLRVDYLANPVATERIANLVALDDAGGTRLAFTDNYRLKFDFYLRLPPGVTLNANGIPTNAGTTEQMLWGVGYTATQPMARGFRSSRGSGMWGWVSGEGGHGAGTGGDVSLYSGTVLSGGRNMDLVNSVADTTTYFAPAFGTDGTVPNCPANKWVEATVTALGGQVTVEYKAIGQTQTKFYENVTGSVAGGVMVGYEDSFSANNSNSIDPDNQWMLLDNMVVEDLTPPSMVVNPLTPFQTFTGAPVTGTWSITNGQLGSNLTISGVTLAGANASDFSVATPLPLVIPQGTTAALDLVFNPAAPDGLKTASFTIASDDPGTPAYVVSGVTARRSVGSFLQAHYKMDELTGTSVADSSGHGPAGTLQVREPVAFGNPSLLGAGDTGFSMGLLPAQSGTTGCYLTSPVVHTPSFSISLWMKPAAAGALRTLFQRDSDFATPYDKICGLLLTDTGTLRYRVRSTDVFESAPVITDGSVYHVVLTHLDTDGFTNDTAVRSRLYVNGLIAAETTGATTPGFADYPPVPLASGLHIGSRTTAGAGFSGDLDDIQIHGVELSREQVWALYQQPGLVPSPRFEALSAALTTAPAVFSVTFPSSPQGTYRLFRSENLSTWNPAGDSAPGHASSATTTLTDPAPPLTRQYYRVERQ